MKALVLCLAVFFTTQSWAALPLFQYSWHTKAASSQLMIFEDGSILHQERNHYNYQTIMENKLSEVEISGLKVLIKNILAGAVKTGVADINEDSHFGTIELRTERGLKIVEGIVKDSTDAYRARSYHATSEDIQKLKTFISVYTHNDM
jgi:hypothetical protein